MFKEWWKENKEKAVYVAKIGGACVAGGAMVLYAFNKAGHVRLPKLDPIKSALKKPEYLDWGLGEDVELWPANGTEGRMAIIGNLKNVTSETFTTIGEKYLDAIKDDEKVERINVIVEAVRS